MPCPRWRWAAHPLSGGEALILDRRVEETGRRHSASSCLNDSPIRKVEVWMLAERYRASCLVRPRLVPAWLIRLFPLVSAGSLPLLFKTKARCRRVAAVSPNVPIRAQLWPCPRFVCPSRLFTCLWVAPERLLFAGGIAAAWQGANILRATGASLTLLLH